MSEQQTGFEEAVQVGTASASHIRSLKTISTFCEKLQKGAAIGGPLGAAIGAALFKPTHVS